MAQEDGKIKSTPKRKANMAKTVNKVWCRDLRDDLRRLGTFVLCAFDDPYTSPSKGFDANGSSDRADLANR